MKVAAAKIIRIILLGVLILSSAGLLRAQTDNDQTPIPDREKTVPLPELADIIPMSGELEGRLAALNNTLQQMLNITPVKKDCDAFKTEAESFDARLQRVKNADNRKWSQLVDLSQELQDALARFKDIENPLFQKINHLAGWKAEWLAEKRKWLDWKSRLLTEQDSLQLKTAISSAVETIDAALKLLTQQLDTALEIQIRNKSVRTKMAVLKAEIDNLITVGRRDYLLTASPPMYSTEYFSQFKSKVWQTALENVRALSLPDRLFIVQHGWTLVAQFLLFIAVIFSIHRNREVLHASKRWQFLALRPFATAFFVVILTQLLVFERQHMSLTVRIFICIVGGVSFARILMVLVEDSWRRRGILAVINLYIVSMLLTAISLPLPLYRLYIFLVSLLAICFLSRWVAGGASQPDSILFPWGLRLGYILLGVILFAQIRGKEGLAFYLFNSTLTSLAIILAFCLFVYMIRGGLRWIFFSSPVWKIKQLRSEAELLSSRTGYLVEALIVWFVLLPMLLTIWGMYGSISEATKELLALGFNIGSARISVGLVLTAMGTLYGSLILSWILPKVLLDEKVAGANLERGVRISVGHLIQYFIVLIGVIMMFSALGLDFTKLTIILGSLGVGIGFGLQGLVNNFFSGLVLLFEQPVRVGDNIEVSEKLAEIKSIGLRSTTVQTFDKADVIIPNADLISKVVTNWTLSNRQMRVSVSVGVAYGSDVSLVIGTLLASAVDHEKVMKSPPAQVLFLQFGASSLDFELRVWITDADYRWLIVSDLNQEIERRFREANIEIAFPQLDVHLRSINNPAMVRPANNSEPDKTGRNR